MKIFSPFQARIGTGPVLLLSLAALVLFPLVARGLDNASLLPPVLPDAQVKLEDGSPDWIKSLIMVQFRIETATPEGTFAAAVKVLDHYAQMGVNGLWINPIYERGSRGNGYGNFGPDTIEPLLTGGRNTGESFAVVRKFVEEAHRRNIRVIFDIIVWGTSKGSPLVKEHPEFYRKIDGKFWEVWGGYGFDWKNPRLQKWFEKAAVEFIEQTGADGFRVDLAPDTSGYFFENVRRKLASRGRKVLIVSEIANERKKTFDFEQNGVTGWTEEPDYVTPGKIQEQKARFGPAHEYLLKNNIVDVIQSGRGIGKPALQQQGRGGEFRYYTSNLLCHDDKEPAAKGSRVRFAYGTLFAPFLPMWWIGEEWNNPKAPLPGPGGTGVMYFNTINWTAAENSVNAAFLEDIKKYIRIRRSFPEIFEYFPDSARKANIAKVASRLDGSPNPLQAYARFRNGRAVLIVPNDGNAPARASVAIDAESWAITLSPTRMLAITDLMTDTVLAIRKAADEKPLEAEIPAGHLGIYLVEVR